MKGFKSLDFWLAHSLDPDLVNESEAAEIAQRYSSIENMVKYPPASLRVDRGGKFHAKVPIDLLTAVKTITTLSNESQLRSMSRAISNMLHFGIVRLLKDHDARRFYHLSRALAYMTSDGLMVFPFSMPSIVLLPPDLKLPNTKTVTVYPLVYDLDKSIMNNVEVLRAVFGQIMPIDALVTWALSKAVLFSDTADRTGVWYVGRRYNDMLTKAAEKEFTKKAQLAVLVYSNPDIYRNGENWDKIERHLMEAGVWGG